MKSKTTTKRNVYKDVLKPTFDKSAAVVGIAMFWWVFAAIALAVTIDDPGPPIFTQRRVGKKRNGRIACFKIIKFRTMTKDAPAEVPTHMFENSDEYVTRVGRILRKYSLDEIPQLFNVLAGDMAWIGPRPHLWNQDDLIRLRERSGANDLLPGLTGWAQVNGRDDLDVPEKASYDAEYAREMNAGFRRALAMDLKVLKRTFWTVVKAEGSK